MPTTVTSLTVPAAHAAAIVLAQQPGQGDNGGQGEDFGKSSPLGLLVLLLFFIAVALLVRSMTRHLGRVPTSFDGDGTDAAGDGEGAARDGGSADAAGVDGAGGAAPDSAGPRVEHGDRAGPDGAPGPASGR
ncbi:hypothetical protein [Haloechinothrix aidingensis]|uniref:hypothetical protein n=1 Tax=Haloechinothrix aidingensis TaxID=2752311 RepID=UPI001FEAE0E3|nr:hypothetical protein [Haloechinothrix aidingensis]